MARLVLGRAGPAREQSERLRLVHQGRSAGRRQVGEIPPVALRRGRDDVGDVRGPRSGRAPGATVDRLAVLAARRGMDEQHADGVLPPEQLHALPARSSYTVSLNRWLDGYVHAGEARPRPVRLVAGSGRHRCGAPVRPLFDGLSSRGGSSLAGEAHHPGSRPAGRPPRLVPRRGQLPTPGLRRDALRPAGRRRVRRATRAAHPRRVPRCQEAFAAPPTLPEPPAADDAAQRSLF